MSNAPVIGAVDLTVQLTSMNPLGHIDANEANKQFERRLIQAAWYTVRNSRDKNDLLKHGLIVEGPGAKYFRLRRTDDLVRFCTRVRTLLVEERLPFKLCVRKGELTNTALRDKWAPVLDRAQDGNLEAQRSLIEEFNTNRPKEIEQIFDIYRAPGFKNDAVKLSLDIEGFKGLGLYFVEDLKESFKNDDRFFRNYYPTRLDRRASYVDSYIDCKFEFSSDDLIWRYVEDANSRDDNGVDHSGVAGAQRDVSEQQPGGGSASVIEGGIDLMKRSFNANPQYSSFYLSFLITVVRSSVFTELKYLEQEEIDEDGEGRLAIGWQGAPVILDTLFDRMHRPMFKNMLGIEYVIGSVLDEIYCAVARATPSSSLDEDAKEQELIGAAVVREVTFREAVLRVQAAFGKAHLRRVFDLPSNVLKEERKRAVLSIASQ